MQEEKLTMQQMGGRALRDAKPPGYFTSLVKSRWKEYYRTHPEAAKKARLKKARAKAAAAKK